MVPEVRVQDWPETQVVDRIVEVPQVQQVIREVPRIEYHEVIREVPKIEVRYQERPVMVPEVRVQDKVVEVPQVQEVVRRVPRIQVHEIPVERVIQIPRKEIKWVEQPVYVPVPQVVQVPVEKVVHVPKVQVQTVEVVKQVPVPQIVDVEVDVPVYVPQYIDVEPPRQWVPQPQQRALPQPMNMVAAYAGVRVYVYELKMDSAEKGGDPYVRLIYGDETRPTATKQNAGGAAVFNEKIELGYKGLDTKLSLQVLDQDKGVDELWGSSLPLNLDQLPKDPSTGQWYGEVDLFEDGDQEKGKKGKLTVAIALAPGGPRQQQQLPMQPTFQSSGGPQSFAPQNFAPGTMQVAGGMPPLQQTFAPGGPPPGMVGQTFAPGGPPPMGQTFAPGPMPTVPNMLQTSPPTPPLASRSTMAEPAPIAGGPMNLGVSYAQ